MPEVWPEMPEPGPPPSFQVPDAISFTLSNGMPVTLVQTGKIPLIQAQMNVRTGSAADPVGKEGLASFSADMLNEGTDSRSALELSAELLTLASSVYAGADLETAYLRLSCLEDKLDETLSIAADMVMRASFDSADVERVRTERRNALIAAKDNLRRVGARVFRRVLYGDQYLGRPTRGRQDSLERITPDDLVHWHARAWVPENASWVIVGRISPEDARELLERHFGGWTADHYQQHMALDPEAHSGGVPSAAAVEVGVGERTVYWVDRPGAEQSYLAIGHVAPAWDAELQAARVLGNMVLGGQFSSRLNLNLREDKGYTYGARSSVRGYPGGGLFMASASVKTTTTAASITEFLKEIDGIVGDSPITGEEFVAVQGRLIQGQPARYEGLSGVLGQFASADALQRPEGWLSGYADRIGGVVLAGAQEQLQSVLKPESLAVVVVGDYEAVGAEVEALGLGRLVFLDDDGAPVPLGSGGP